MKQKIYFPFWTSIISIIISCGLLIAWILTKWNLQLVDSNSFMSVCTMLITASVTLLVGYQIYNSIELNKKISKIKQLEFELEQARDEFKKMGLELSAEIDFSDYDRKWEQDEKLFALIKLQSSLAKILETGKDIEDYDTRLNLLSFHINGLSKENFKKEKPDAQNFFRLMWKANSEKMRKLPKYGLLSEILEPLNITVKKLTEENND